MILTNTQPSLAYKENPRSRLVLAVSPRLLVWNLIFILNTFFSFHFPTQLYFKQVGDPVNLKKTTERNKFMQNILYSN